MNFGDDDLLGDILSDGSNDSFFDDPKITKKSSPQKPSDIFNTELKQEAKTEAPKSDWLGLGKIIKETEAPTLAKPKKIVKKISFEDEDDILGTLGLKKTPEKSTIDDAPISSNKDIKSGRKSDFLESILKPPKQELSLFDDILLNKKQNKTEEQTFSSVSKADSLPTLGQFESSNEGRRRRKSATSSSGLMDPLGLFSSSKDNIDKKSKDDDTKPSSAISSISAKSSETTKNVQEALPDWLGGSSTKTKSESEFTGISSTKSRSELNLSEKTDNITQEIKTPISLQNQDISSENMENISQNQILNSFMTHHKMAQSQLEYQNTAISLQQQESQILMALQLKKYEENLMEIQRQQQEVLVKQEQQFNALLERQFSKQHALENNMRLQQERINNHIQLLLSQPTVRTPVTKSEESMQKIKDEAEEEQIKMFEQMIANIKQRQHEEIFLLEESYKKQIMMMEESSNNTERRLKSEIEALLIKHEEAVKQVEDAYKREIDKYKQKIQTLDEDNIQEMKMVRSNHLRTIEDIKIEHNAMLEQLRECKKAETSLFKNGEELSKKFETGLDILITNSALLQNVTEKVGKNQDTLNLAKEESIRAKEKEIDMMRTSLEKCRESAESERAQLLALVRNLETKLVDQSQNAREDRWAMQQAVATLSARAAAFDREMEFSKASIEREREQLKTLKDSMLVEQERIMAQLTEEKLAVSAEKSRLEIASKLNLNFDAQKAKAEIDAALKVAQEATVMTDREREILQRQQVELETLRRTLHDKERKINIKEVELSRLAQMADEKSQEGERAMEEAKTLESRYNDRMKHLQYQLVQLSSREKKLAEEKISLSQERLTLNTLIRQSKQCSLCSADTGKSEERFQDWNSDARNVPHFPRFNELTDAEIIRLQFEEDKEQKLN